MLQTMRMQAAAAVAAAAVLTTILVLELGWALDNEWEL